MGSGGYNFKDRVGEEHKTLQGYTVKIIEYFGAKNCTIQFDDGLIIKKVQYYNLKNGTIVNPYHKSLCNIGFLGVGLYKCTKNNIYYYSWKRMITRCFMYKNTSVCEEWCNFQNFAKWFEENYNPETMEGWQLDKDILVKNNRVYSPDTCCFVPQEINCLFVRHFSTRGSLPIGVRKSGNKFCAVFKIKNISNYLGTFDTKEEAFQAYKTAKEKNIKEIADEWRNKINLKVYKAMYNYQVEITD